MRVCFGPTPSYSIFLKRVITPRALRPALVDYWLIKPGRSFLEIREGFYAVFHPSLMKGRQILLPPLIQQGLKHCFLWKWKDQHSPFLSVSLMHCWERYTALCFGVWTWTSSWWGQEVWFTIWSANITAQQWFDQQHHHLLLSIYFHPLFSLLCRFLQDMGCAFFLASVCFLIHSTISVFIAVYYISSLPAKQFSFWCFISPPSKATEMSFLTVCNKERRLESISSIWYVQRGLGQLFEGSPKKH